MQLGYNKLVRKANEKMLRNTKNETSKNILYGDKGTVYDHECKPPICPLCHHLTVRAVTKEEKEMFWPTYEGAKVPHSSGPWCKPLRKGERAGEATTYE